MKILLEYRDCDKSDEFAQIACLINLAQFFYRCNRFDLYRNYLFKLYEVQSSRLAKIEAALALKKIGDRGRSILLKSYYKTLVVSTSKGVLTIEMNRIKPPVRTPTLFWRVVQDLLSSGNNWGRSEGTTDFGIYRSFRWSSITAPCNWSGTGLLPRKL